jgi:hypothetical protein
MGEARGASASTAATRWTPNYNRISAAPKFGTREIWHLINDGGGWDHPIHIHFEEGQISGAQRQLRQRAAGGARPQGRLPADAGGTVTITMQFRDWGGMFMEHCHNTTHEDNAMLLRWEINGGGEPFLSRCRADSDAARRDVRRPGVGGHVHAADSPRGTCLRCSASDGDGGRVPRGPRRRRQRALGRRLFSQRPR